jgi:AcrR family transcriptional regulator
VAHRRRGAALEDAILEAAWDQLLEGGYQAFTIEAVAERAHTSRPVVYRRWAGRPELMRAAIAHFGDRNPFVVPDTGNLRDDVLELLNSANRGRGAMVALISAHLATFFEETGTSPAQLREEIIRGRPSSMRTIVDRAIARGEVAAERMTERVVSLPLDLFRHDMLMSLKPLSPATLASIVDEVFLPLAHARAPRSTASRE